MKLKVECIERGFIMASFDLLSWLNTPPFNPSPSFEPLLHKFFTEEMKASGYHPCNFSKLTRAQGVLTRASGICFPQCNVQKSFVKYCASLRDMIHLVQEAFPFGNNQLEQTIPKVRQDVDQHVRDYEGHAEPYEP